MKVFPAILNYESDDVTVDPGDVGMDVQSLCYAHDLHELMQVHAGLSNRYQSLLRATGQQGLSTSAAAACKSNPVSWLALHDSLTGLPNKWLLSEHMDAILASVQSGQQKFALIHIGLNHFESLPTPDRHLVLREVVGRLQRVLRHTDVLARIGKATFAVLLHDVQSDVAIRNVADKILASVASASYLTDSMRWVSCSLGCSRYPADGTESHVLGRHADVALQMAHRAGGGQLCIHAQTSPLSPAVSLGRALWGAAERGELQVKYQPQWSMGECPRLWGYSAALSWLHPELGELASDSFMPVAHRNGATQMLCDWLLRNVLREMTAWHVSGIQGLRVSVNVLPSCIETSEFADRLLGWVMLAGVQPSCLELVVSDPMPGQTVPNPAALDRLRQKGFRVARACGRQIFAGWAGLPPIPLDCIRLDSELVQTLSGSEQARALCRCHVELGQTLGLDVVADGVDTNEQWAILHGMGCQQFQGAMMGLPTLKPDPANEKTSLYLKPPTLLESCV